MLLSKLKVFLPLLLLLFVVPVIAGCAETRAGIEDRLHADNYDQLAVAAARLLAEEGLPAADVTWDGTAGQSWENYLDQWPENPYGENGYQVVIRADGEIRIKPGVPGR